MRLHNHLAKHSYLSWNVDDQRHSGTLWSCIITIAAPDGSITPFTSGPHPWPNKAQAKDAAAYQALTAMGYYD